ncbi:MAG: response regulator [Oscillatoria sp. PMC 1068.18]|nr:response regulator [Oscillatoria sp. PMC 1076.18]MEC4987649.1 response regulator [Oscillatoria sp. PMC 1068.18]
MSNEKILVVDDEKNIRLTVAQCLDPLGYEVSTALNGEDALKQLKAQEFQLILSDLKMPGMNGMEFLREAIALHPDLQVIMISAHGTVDNAVEAMKLGAVDFIQKPFTPKELRDVVYRVLNREHHAAKQESKYRKALELALYAASKRQFEQAIAHAKQAIGLDPARPEAFTLLGELQETTGSRTEALKNYRVSLDLDPTYKPAQENLSRATRSPKSRPSL